ncbi:MAG: hypothetical protein COS57_16220, partial [Syntrophobacterales bacterium CG03_land_8_20_14_0_80_58_14]
EETEWKKKISWKKSMKQPRGMSLKVEAAHNAPLPPSLMFWVKKMKGYSRPQREWPMVWDSPEMSIVER